MNSLSSQPPATSLSILRGFYALSKFSFIAFFATVVVAVAQDVKKDSIRIPRGRPFINAERTTLVADNGNRLRGACLVPEIAGLLKLKELGLNTVHHYAEGFDPKYPAAGSRGPGYHIEEMDRLVKLTRDLGLYFVFTIGGEAKFNHQWTVDFWKLYAPRYANETHVIYEIQNEPVGWSPPYSSPNANPPGAVEMNIDAYKVIRAAAPKTAILIFSYSQMGGQGGKDALKDVAAFNEGVGGDLKELWSNTAVAFHGYAGHLATAEAVKALLAGGYPAIMTEFYTSPWGGDRFRGMQDIELTGALEEMGVSWISFLYTPPAPWGLDVTNPLRFKEPIEQAAISWAPDYGTWPVPRAPFGNGSLAREVGKWESGKLSGKVHIEYEEFDIGGEGIAYYDRTPKTNDGKAIRKDEGVDVLGDTQAADVQFVRADEGEWLEYTVYVREPGEYDLALRHANASSGSVVRVTLGGSEVIKVPLNRAGEATVWKTQSLPVFLGYGRAVLRMQMVKGSADLDWFEVSPVTEGSIPSGVRKVFNRASGLALASGGGHVQQAPFTGDKAQLWEFKHLGANQYRITSQANGALWNRVYWGSNRINLSTRGHENPDRLQRFLLRSTGDGYYRLAPVDAGYDVILASQHVAAPLTQGDSPFAGETSRQWAILPPDSVGIPARLTAERNDAGHVVLNWRGVSGATGYNVKRSAKIGGPYFTVKVPGGDTTITDASAPKNRLIYYVVSATDGNGESPDSAEAHPGLLHASYSFDETGPTIIDGVRGGWNGSLVGSPERGPGLEGKALIFDGADDHVILPPGMISTLKEVSITAWIRLDAAPKWARLVDFGNDKETHMYFTPVNGGNNLQFTIKKGETEFNVTGSKSVATGRWAHVAAVLRGGVASVYLDGKEIGNSSGWTLTPEALGKTVHNYIGKSQFPDPLLKGRVDDLRIYSIGLSGADIERLASRGPGGEGR